MLNEKADFKKRFSLPGGVQEDSVHQVHVRCGPLPVGLPGMEEEAETA